MVLQGIYRYRWTSDISTPELYELVLHQWHSDLIEISDEFIKKAIFDLKTKFPKNPPTPGEFYDLCVSHRSKYKWSVDIVPKYIEQRNEDGTRYISERSQECKNDMWRKLGKFEKVVEVKRGC